MTSRPDLLSPETREALFAVTGDVFNVPQGPSEETQQAIHDALLEMGHTGHSQETIEAINDALKELPRRF
jgi:hypothetical protein